MTDPARWLELERLYHAALEQPPDQRASFARQACSHDEWLRRELQSLLAHDRPDDDFLDQPAIGVAARELTEIEIEPAALEPGSLIGPYKVLDQIARGGMGVVYRAEQQYPVRRAVALKVIKPGMDSEHVVTRFQAERQAVALMDHPNIARVFDAGTTSAGRLYFVMEMVDGLPITEYCREHDLSLRDRLALFIPVCQAIQHAHQKGVIHRDIKPSNILVTVYDGKPVPKVIDFGIAKAMHQPLTERSMHTQAGAVIGTFEYMSPEQAGSFGEDIDTRSDVYALGAVLYELIAGSTPLNRASLTNSSELDIVRRIREEDPPPPSVRLSDPKLSRTVRGDLDWAVMKALEKDRSRRYDSANRLAGDLQHYLAGETVEAAPPSVSYRMRKFARRHRVGLLTASAFSALLIAGVVVSSRMAIRAGRAEQEAVAVNDFLQNDLLAQAGANAQSGSSASPDPDMKVRTAVDRAAERIAGKFDRQPQVEAAIRYTIGQTYLDLGQYPQARKQLERALDLQRRVLGARNPKTLRTMSRLGAAFWRQGKYPEAESILNQTLEIQRRVLGPEHPDTLRTMTSLGAAYRQHGKFVESAALHNQLLPIERRVLGPEHPDTLYSMNSLADSYRQLGKYAQAEALNFETLEIRRRVLGPENPDTLNSINSLAGTYFEEGKFQQAEALFNQALEIRRRVQGPEHPHTLIAMNNLAAAYIAEGKQAEAEATLTQAVAIERRVVGPEHSQTLTAMTNLAFVYGLDGKYAESEALFKQTLEARRRVTGPRHPHTLGVLANLAEMYQRQGKYALAQAYASEALDGRRSTLGPDHPDTMDSAADLALAFESQGKFTESEPLAREAFETDRRLRPDGWQLYRAESLLGAGLAGQKKYAAAEPLLIEGYQGMLQRKDRISVPYRDHLDRARQWVDRWKSSDTAR